MLWLQRTVGVSLADLALSVSGDRPDRCASGAGSSEHGRATGATNASLTNVDNSAAISPGPKGDRS